MGTKRCRECGEEKPLDDFYVTSTKKRSGVPYRQARCKPCYCAAGRVHYSEHRDRINRRIADYNRRKRLARWGLDAEPESCNICGATPDSPRNGAYSSGGTRQRPSKGLSLDHDHVTGKPRGVLCSQCNRAIGLMDDDPELFAKAALYIQQYRAKVATIV